jgi:hypothetical protein
LDHEPLIKLRKLAFESQFYVGAGLFRQRPNFLADLAEILKISWQHWFEEMWGLEAHF